MINYRIRKETYDGFPIYYPQKGFLGIWWDMFNWWGGYVGFMSYDEAKEALCNYRRGTKVEYLEVSCGGDEE